MRVVSLLNLFLLSLNLAAFGTLVYKTRASKPLQEPDAAVGEELGLTAEQTETIVQQRESFVADSQRIGGELEQLREELLEAVRRQAAEPAAVERKVEQMTRLQGRLERQAVGQLVRESELMSAEQRDLYFDHIRSRMRRGRGCGRRGRWSRETESSAGGPVGKGIGRGGRRGRR
jgi:hypothetical protein